MAAMAGALVLNIGTLSEHWIEAMLSPGRPAGGQSCSTRSVRGDALGRSSCAFLDELEIAVLRGNAAEIATLAGREAGSGASSRSARRIRAPTSPGPRRRCSGQSQRSPARPTTSRTVSA